MELTLNSREEIVDRYYELWHQHDITHTDEPHWRYADMVRHAYNVNKLHALCILVSVYDSQVNNGGHDQYQYNGYADNGGGCFATHFGTEMHDLMLALMVEYGFDREPVYHIMRMFKVSDTSDCDDCGGSGFITEVDDDGDPYEDTCGTCCGSGTFDEPSVPNADHLNDLYYALSDAWLVKFDAWLALRKD